MKMNDETLQKHFNLLQEQFQKLNTKYQILKQEHDNLSSLKDCSFSSNLLQTIKSLYKNKKYSDISIKLQRSIIPGHKLVLEAHFGEWGPDDLSSMDELSLENVDQSVGEQVVKWLYTHELKDNQNYNDLWTILEIAHTFHLINLKSRCQDNLTSTVSSKNCIYFYQKSCEFCVENLQKYCMELIIANWIDYQPSEFNSLSANILLELFEAQSNYPLHTAVRFNRDDVVFVYINDNFSQLEDVVNIVSDTNEIVLDLALLSRRTELCQTLLNNCVNLNIVDNNGWSLLHKAIQRRDDFSAKFLIENGCYLNPLSPHLSQTPLQLIAKMKPLEESAEVLNAMLEIARMLIKFGANVNSPDSNDMTAICLAILSDNVKVLRIILESGRCTDVNGINSYSLSKTKGLTSSPRGSRSMLSGNVAPQPLWLAVCREYRQELLYKYEDFSNNPMVESSLTKILLEHGADPTCIYDLGSGNSIFLEIISQQMEDAAIYILRDFQNRSTVSVDNKSCLEPLLTLTNNSKETSLHIAVENEFDNLCKLLLILGSDPNVIRRKLVNTPQSILGDETSSSLESINSLSSPNRISDPSRRNSPESPSLNSSCSSKLIDLNPFKEFMVQDHEVNHISLSYSLPLINKSNQGRSSLFETVLNKNQQKDYVANNFKKSKSQQKLKRITNEVNVDLCAPTHLAIKSRNLGLITLFIDHEGINWLLPDVKGESPFSLSLWNDLITVADKIFQKMSQQGIKIQKIDDICIGENGLLHLAILKDNIDAVRFLIKIGCNINIISSTGISPLQLTIEKGNVNIVKLLCIAGADPNFSYQRNISEINRDLICPLWASLKYDRFDIAEILAENGAEVDLWFADSKDIYDQSLLHKAILEENEDSAIFLITYNCDITSPMECKLSPDVINTTESSTWYVNGSTPLHLACQKGLKLVVQNLLKRKDIIVNAQNSQGSTAIHLAIQYKQDSILSLLLDPNIHLNLLLRDVQGHTPFHVAMAMSNQVVARTILQLEPNAANEVDNMGRNFLHVAVETLNREAMFFLIQINVNLNVRVKDIHGYTPLQLAVITGTPEDMVRSLILAGARIEDETIEKQNLLHLCVIHEKIALINCLIDNGVSLSHQDHNLDTPLHLAMKLANKQIIEQLLKKSSRNIRIKNLKGENVLHILANNAKENDVIIFSILMDLFKEFPINEGDAAGNTALFLSVLHDRTKLSIAILMKGASLGCINNDGVSLFNCNQVSERILLKLLDSLDSEPRWLDGEICVSCLCKFNIKNRKHHCRHCGRLICGKCSINEIPIVRFGITKPVRVCDTCFNFIVNGKIK